MKKTKIDDFLSQIKVGENSSLKSELEKLKKLVKVKIIDKVSNDCKECAGQGCPGKNDLPKIYLRFDGKNSDQRNGIEQFFANITSLETVDLASESSYCFKCGIVGIWEIGLKIKNSGEEILFNIATTNTHHCTD